MRDVPLVAVEQPLSPADDSKLVPLVDDGLLSGTVGRVGRTRLPGSAPEAPIVVLDESLRTLDDAQTLVEAGIGGGFNIRIAKCGGLIPSLRLAAFARREGVQIQLGCMVGETSLLSAAAIRFLEVCPGVRWAEGCFGKLLLRDEIVARPLRFGFGGRPPKPNSGVWGRHPTRATWTGCVFPRPSCTNSDGLSQPIHPTAPPKSKGGGRRPASAPYSTR